MIFDMEKKSLIFDMGTPVSSPHFHAPIPIIIEWFPCSYSISLSHTSLLLFYSFHYSYSRPPFCFCSYSILIIPLLLFHTTILFLLLFHSKHSITPIPDRHFMCLLLFHSYHSIIPIPDRHFVFYSHSILIIPLLLFQTAILFFTPIPGKTLMGVIFNQE